MSRVESSPLTKKVVDLHVHPENRVVILVEGFPQSFIHGNVNQNNTNVNDLVPMFVVCLCSELMIFSFN